MWSSSWTAPPLPSLSLSITLSIYVYAARKRTKINMLISTFLQIKFAYENQKITTKQNNNNNNDTYHKHVSQLKKKSTEKKAMTSSTSQNYSHVVYVMCVYYLFANVCARVCICVCSKSKCLMLWFEFEQCIKFFSDLTTLFSSFLYSLFFHCIWFPIKFYIFVAWQTDWLSEVRIIGIVIKCLWLYECLSIRNAFSNWNDLR